MGLPDSTPTDARRTTTSGRARSASILNLISEGLPVESRPADAVPLQLDDEAGAIGARRADLGDDLLVARDRQDHGDVASHHRGGETGLVEPVAVAGPAAVGEDAVDVAVGRVLEQRNDHVPAGELTRDERRQLAAGVLVLVDIEEDVRAHVVRRVADVLQEEIEVRGVVGDVESHDGRRTVAEISWGAGYERAALAADGAHDLGEDCGVLTLLGDGDAELGNEQEAGDADG